MNFTTVIIAVFIFSIVTFGINILLIGKTKEKNKADLDRLIGSIICFISSGILLILYRGNAKEQFDNLGKAVYSYSNEHVGISLNEIIIGLTVVLFIAVVTSIIFKKSE